MAVKYYGKSGSALNTGLTPASPKLTIQDAVNLAVAGDIVECVDTTAEIYYESIVPPVSGSAIAGPIVIKGAKAGTVRLTTVDGSTAVGGTWTLATGSESVTGCGGGSFNFTGKNIYRLAGLSPEPYLLMDPSGDVFIRIHRDYMGTVREQNNYCLTGPEQMGAATGATSGTDYGYSWWNGLEVMWGYRPSSGVTYVRYRGGDDPNTKALRYSGYGAVFDLTGKSYIYLDGFIIRGRNIGVIITPTTITGGANYDGPLTSHNIINDCNIQAPDHCVFISGRTDTPEVAGCKLESGLLGMRLYPPLSSIKDPTLVYEAAREPSWRQYAFLKFMNDKSNSLSTTGVGCFSGNTSGGALIQPTNVEVHHSEITNLVLGMECSGGNGIYVHHNTIHNLSDTGFQLTNNSPTNVEFHHNLFYEGKYGIRVHFCQQDGNLYIYNNRFTGAQGVSDFVYLDCQGGGNANMVVRVYHNSFHGGNTIFQWGATTNFANFLSVNNFANHPHVINSSCPTLDAVDYFSATSSIGCGGGSYGTHNSSSAVPIWTLGTTPNDVELNFIVPVGHSILASGLDISQTFTLVGTSYGALPGYTAGYFTGAAPDRGIIAEVGAAPFIGRAYIGQGF